MIYVSVNILNAVFSFTLLLYVGFLGLPADHEKALLLIIANFGIISIFNSAIGDLILKTARRYGWGKLSYVLLFQILLSTILCFLLVRFEKHVIVFYLAVNLIVRISLISVIIHRGKRQWIAYNLADKASILVTITSFMLGIINEECFTYSVIFITIASFCYMCFHVLTVFIQDETAWVEFDLRKFFVENLYISISIVSAGLVYPVYRFSVIAYSPASEAYEYALLLQAVSIFVLVGSAYSTRAAHNNNNILSEIYQTIFVLFSWCLVIVLSGISFNYLQDRVMQLSYPSLILVGEIAYQITNINIFLFPFILSGYLAQIAIRRAIFTQLIVLSIVEILLLLMWLHFWGYSDFMSIILLPKLIAILYLVGTRNELY